MKFKFEYTYHGKIAVVVEADDAVKASEQADIMLDYIPAETIIRDALWTTRQVEPFTTDSVNYPYNP